MTGNFNFSCVNRDSGNMRPVAPVDLIMTKLYSFHGAIRFNEVNRAIGSNLANEFIGTTQYTLNDVTGSIAYISFI